MQSSHKKIRRIFEQKLPPARSMLDVSIEDESEERKYDVYDSPCRFEGSNEEFSTEDVNDFPLCDISFYGGCYEDLEALENDNANALYRMRIFYDYELRYERNGILEREIQFVEEVMLEHIAKSIGLNDCSMRLRHGRTLAKSLSPRQEQLVLGVSSVSTDRPDPDFEDCFVPVPRSVAQDSFCRPITGELRLYIRNDPLVNREDLFSISNALHRVIEKGMRQDIYTGNVVDVNYIGVRTSEGGVGNQFNNPANQNPVKETTPPQEVSRLNTGLVIFGSVALFLVAALAVFWIGRRDREPRPPKGMQWLPDTHSPMRRNRFEQEDDEVEQENDSSSFSEEAPIQFVATR